MSNLDFSYTQNRELSWLEFNIRVLNEAHDLEVPDLEKLTFVSIFTSNLDEFFMVRVGSLNDLAKIKEQVPDNKSNMTNKDQLKAIFDKMPELYERKDRAYFEVEDKLRSHNVCNLAYKELSPEEKSEVDLYFDTYLSPLISPLTVDSRHPFQNFQANHLYIICEMNIDNEDVIGIVPKPLSSPPLLVLSSEGLRYILIEEIIKGNLNKIFPYQTKNSGVFSVTRSADLDLEEGLDEFDDDIRKHMRKSLKKRKRLEPVRLQIQGKISEDSLAYLKNNLGLSDEKIFYCQSPLIMKYAFALFDHLERLDEKIVKEITNKAFEPKVSKSIDPTTSILDQVEKEDKLLFYPYETIESFLMMLKEAATDPDVISIKITIYRLASYSKVVEYLAAAAENGKEVIVLMELKARFDEDNNINWSERLEEAGCTLIYGFEGYKVHSKICFITRHRHGQIQYISQYGTGNYNEKTSTQYTDLSLITADKDLGIDAQKFFNNMMVGNLQGDYNHLLVAPNGLKPKIIDLIDEEIQKSKSGGQGKIWIKCNSLTERDIIDKLAAASQAGVEIFMNIRGICCLVPGIQDKTESVKITSIVGRYLEHPRIYMFGAKDPKIYISSADLMTRNLQRRVEIACPIYAENTKEKILDIAKIYEEDDRKSRILQADGTYIRDISENPLSAQDTFMRIANTNFKEVQEKYKTTKSKSKNLRPRTLKDDSTQGNPDLDKALEEKLSSMSLIEKIRTLFLK